MKQTKNFTAVDRLNAKTGTSLKDVVGEQITVDAVAVLDKPTTTGNDHVGVIKAADGKIYTTISVSAIDTLSDVIDILNSGEISTAIDIKIEQRRSAKGRDFINLTVLINE